MNKRQPELLPTAQTQHKNCLCKYKLDRTYSRKIAGPGFEPGSAVPETAVLPLDDPAICELYQVIRLKVMRLVY